MMATPNHSRRLLFRKSSGITNNYNNQNIISKGRGNQQLPVSMLKRKVSRIGSNNLENQEGLLPHLFHRIPWQRLPSLIQYHRQRQRVPPRRTLRNQSLLWPPLQTVHLKDDKVMRATKQAITTKEMISKAIWELAIAKSAKNRKLITILAHNHFRWSSRWCKITSQWNNQCLGKSHNSNQHVQILMPTSRKACYNMVRITFAKIREREVSVQHRPRLPKPCPLPTENRIKLIISNNPQVKRLYLQTLHKRCKL